MNNNRLQNYYIRNNMFNKKKLTDINDTLKNIKEELNELNKKESKLCGINESFKRIYDMNVETINKYNKELNDIKENEKKLSDQNEKYKNALKRIYHIISYILSILYGTILAIGRYLFNNNSALVVYICVIIALFISILTYYQTPWEGCNETNIFKKILSLFNSIKGNLIETFLVMLSPFCIEIFSIFFLYCFHVKLEKFETDVEGMAYQIVFSSMSGISVVLYFMAVFLISVVALFIKYKKEV